MKQCVATLVSQSDSYKRMPGDKCGRNTHGESDYCWTHHMAIIKGIRTQKDVREGKGVEPRRREKRS